MPLTLDGFAGSRRSTPGCSFYPTYDGKYSDAEAIHIALVNNMPDAALEDTEKQFCELLAAAAGSLPVHLRLYSLPEVTRGERSQEHMSGLYSDFRELRSELFDGLIITGTEPQQPELRNEAYWQTLVSLFDWAERNTTSTILSCLAAHASVLHSDGIERHLLSHKRFGIFEERKPVEHFLTAGTSDPIRIPHSRWNELWESDLLACGYAILTRSEEAGPGLFAKQRGKSLFLYIQGHPEYEAQTLFKEYRRDIKRFLRNERKNYPPMPRGYFSAPASRLAAAFEERASSAQNEDALAFFPESSILQTVQNGWHLAGMIIYGNWLTYLAEKRKTELLKRPISGSYHQIAFGKRSAVV